MKTDDTRAQLLQILRDLRLPTVRDYYQDAARLAQQESLSYEQFLKDVLERECEARWQSRVERLTALSHLPLEKTFDNCDLTRLPLRAQQQVRALQSGLFVKRRENVLAFGNPGSGKTHLLCAVSHLLIRQGYRVLYTTTSTLVQELLVAKRDLCLPRLLKRLSRFDAILVDDLGYVQQSREEMEVLFTLLAERYERGSVLITSNLPFSEWERIFKDPMTTAAAIDRLVHHCLIVELNLQSYRMAAAHSRAD
ncbi:MAG TPA: IS21-like element helper ATPase IstB, partial [Gammaproteobacteria bacterium]|nr:IS21-like element helper ATPase IstB [Gammaproteobacteria bacterium]